MMIPASKEETAAGQGEVRQGQDKLPQAAGAQQGHPGQTSSDSTEERIREDTGEALGSGQE